MNKIEINKHGHHVIDVVGTGRNGSDEIAYFKEHGYRIGGTHGVFQKLDYSMRIVKADELVQVALVLVRDMLCAHDAVHIKQWVLETFGYISPQCGIAPLLRVALTDDDMNNMGISFIVILDEPIQVGTQHEIITLGVDEGRGGNWMGTLDDGWSSRVWPDNCACAFIVPQ